MGPGITAASVCVESDTNRANGLACHARADTKIGTTMGIIMMIGTTIMGIMMIAITNRGDTRGSTRVLFGAV